MKAMTITVYFGHGQTPDDVTFGSIVNGGTVGAIAAYDLFLTMKIAEAALEVRADDVCIQAVEKIEAASINMLA
jgi:hypothetical protein